MNPYLKEYSFNQTSINCICSALGTDDQWQLFQRFLIIKPKKQLLNLSQINYEVNLFN